jgi:hypothetical protein
MQNMSIFPYSAEDCPASGRIYYTEELVGCSLCGTLLIRPDKLPDSVSIAENHVHYIRCIAVKNIFDVRARRLKETTS